MPRPLVDLLWRDSPLAPAGGSRGPRARHSTGDVVTRAITLADEGGLSAVTVRALAQSLEMTAMSVYTHVNSRDDLLVLMTDHAHALMTATPFGRSTWRTRVRRVADDNLALLCAHPWLLDVDDPRTALGPGTIAKYDHELRAFDGTSISDLHRDAALTLVLDFIRSSAARIVTKPVTGDFGELWTQSVERLACYLGDEFAIAQRVGRAAGESMGGPYQADRAWEFGLARVIAGLADLDGLGAAPGGG
ncbi:TetR/AcrR family transcriptional regulator C-terminal domain-containing protein [Microbacterium sp. PRC9]|uniref:TetR/AcrR family transcriptional regulator n=1 Tax=Microbacterium sp. PRC9 TaxID=2962591 RepID=UPI002880E1FF|nr:TetR/AcrR family transcriptional regulator C-terminal domain-containing protein [Microbacterium sp. PRC9]MDT0144863.1 TetR/AcrR family transcriptional regulator C-terminal domain-containing protein [Microbacterium sp. PRC9]